MERDIPEHHLTSMRQMCALPGTEPLPKKLVDQYWALRTCMDRVTGVSPDMGDLARLCVGNGFGKMTERERNPDVVHLYRTKKIAAGAPVLVLWREEKVEGTLVAVDAMNRITVMIDGVPQQVTAESVTLQAAA